MKCKKCGKKYPISRCPELDYGLCPGCLLDEMLEDEETRIYATEQFLKMGGLKNGKYKNILKRGNKNDDGKTTHTNKHMDK